MRQALGQRFARSEAYEAYRCVTGNQAKANFRKDWAKSELQANQNNMKQAKMTISDREKGTYEPFDKVVQGEGGAQNPQNVEAATKYFSKPACLEANGQSTTPRQREWRCCTSRKSIALRSPGLGSCGAKGPPTLQMAIPLMFPSLLQPRVLKRKLFGSFCLINRNSSLKTTNY